jgi:hypothetical protein
MVIQIKLMKVICNSKNMTIQEYSQIVESQFLLKYQDKKSIYPEQYQ